MDTPHVNGAIKISILDFQKRLLPQAYALQERLKQGEIPTEHDLDFLAELLKKIQQLQSLTVNRSEHYRFMETTIALYLELLEAARNNTSNL